MNNLKNKKLVMFDFDGVLINTMDLWFQINKKTNQNLTREKFDDMSRSNFQDAIDEEIKEGNPTIILDNPNELQSAIEDVLK